MMLVHKHPILPMSPTLVHAHRRNPSAPPVIVQPTRTPGLLSLSKPPRPAPPPHHQRQLHAQQRQNKAMAKPRPQHHLPPSILTPDADKKLSVPAAVPTPSLQPRSRANTKHVKEKTTNSQSRTLIRSSSNNSLRGRPSRQPSPPILPQTRTKISSSQAEGPINRPTQSSNLFDPFLDDVTLNKPQPTLTTKPSGKLAHRRQAGNPTASAPPPSPTPASIKAIPVPSFNPPRTHTLNLSRSDPPVSSHMPPDLRRRSSAGGLVKFDAFPICDDMTDVGDVSDHESSAPVTPTRPKAQIHYRPSPSTAPLTGAFPLFPSAPASAPHQKTHQGGRRHRRSPSEGVFHMSSDEDSMASRINPNVAALFQLARTPGALGKKAPPTQFRTPAPAPKFARDKSPGAAPMKERQFEKEAAEKVAGYFASSSFQNSPGPEDLPEPLFA